MSNNSRYKEYENDPEGFAERLRGQIQIVESELLAWREQARDATDDGGWAANHVEELEDELREMKGDLPENIRYAVENRWPANDPKVTEKALKKAVKIRLAGGRLDEFLM